MSTDLRWWAYLHTNGSIQVKRYFSQLDITEAQESSFVVLTHGPFTAESVEEARFIASNHFVSND